MIVTCGLPTGLRLRVGDEEIVLVCGSNNIDDTFWSSWFDGLPATSTTPAYPDHHSFAPILDGTLLYHTPVLADAGLPAPEEPQPAEDSV